MSMNLFAKLQQSAAQVQTTDTDFSGKFTVDSGAYPAKVKVAYLDASASGAAFVSLEAVLQINGKERTYKENIFISNKEGSLTYQDKKTGEAKPLPGYATIDTLFKATVGKTFAEATTEVRQVKVRNNQTRQDELQPREILMDLLGVDFIAGIIESEEDKYNAPGETVKRNNLNKVFTAEGKTINEQEAGVEGTFLAGWKEANTGKLVNKVKGGTAATVGAPTAQAGTPTLF